MRIQRALTTCFRSPIGSTFGVILGLSALLNPALVEDFYFKTRGYAERPASFFNP